jgi:hypothetical protein
MKATADSSFGKRVRGAGIATAVSLVVAACGGPAASVSPTPVPSAAPDRPSVEPTHSPAAATASALEPRAEWVLTEHTGEPTWSPMLLRAAATNGDRLVAVGGKICDTPQFSYEMPCDAGIWNAPAEDPSALGPVPANDDLFIGTANPIIGPFPGTTDVAAGPGGFVAIGHRGMPSTAIEPVIWVSADGLSWQLAEMGRHFDEATLEAVSAGGPGFVIVGKVTHAAAPRAAVWVSADGRSWERVPAGEAFDVGGYIEVGHRISGGMSRVAAYADGSGLVAIGTRCDAGGTLTDPGQMGGGDTCRAASWTSADGIDWTQTAPDLETHWWLTSIAAMGDAVIAVGGTFESTGQPSAAVALVSRDGTAWEATRLENVPRLDLVVEVPDGVIAFSTDERALRAWASSDGLSWVEITGIPQVEGLAVVDGIGATVVGERLVVVGSAETDLHQADSPFVSFTLVGPARVTNP